MEFRSRNTYDSRRLVIVIVAFRVVICSEDLPEETFP
jgi:hypothetical protein